MIVVSLVKNDLDGLMRTLNSLLDQYPNNFITKILIIDGCSTDGSQELAREICNSNPRFNLHVRKPRGIYDAMNFALSLIESFPESEKGNVLFLNSGDFIVTHDALSLIDDAANEFGWATGMALVSTYKDFPQTWLPQEQENTGFETFDPNKFWIPHQALAINYSILKEVGFFNLEFKLAADYDLICRVWRNFGPPHRVENAFVGQLHVGISNIRTYSAYLEKNKLAQNLGFKPVKLNARTLFKWWLKEKIFMTFPSINPNVRAEKSVIKSLALDPCHEDFQTLCIWCAYQKVNQRKVSYSWG